MSVSVKIFGEPAYVTTVKRGLFTPSPKVDSAVIHIAHVSHKKLEEHTISVNRFFEIVKKGFAHKRKTLKKNLEIGEEVLENCNLNPKSRAEDLSIEHWLRLISKL